MKSRQQRIQTLYEILLSIESRESLTATADKALDAYLQKLNCSVGAVFRVAGTEHTQRVSLTASIPTTPDRNDLFQTARDQLQELTSESDGPSNPVDIRDQIRQNRQVGQQNAENVSMSPPLDESLPIAEQVSGTGEYHIMELPGFGVIVLGKRGGTIEPETVAALAPLNEKLAQACQSNLTEQRLREQRDRFEAVFDAIPEPVVNVIIENGTEYIVRANEAFKQTFVGDDRPIRGNKLNELIIPDDQPSNTIALIEALDQDKPIKQKLTRKTATGTGHFIFSGVPVLSSERTEYFGVYVDITAQKQREQTLEELYEATQGLLEKQSRQQVCAHAIKTVESVLGYSTAGVHLYQRESEALEPVAVNGKIKNVLNDTELRYTDRETIVWQAFENHELIQIDDTRQFDGTLPREETPVRSAVILPIERHGVLITSALEPNSFDDRDVYFLRLLSQLVEVALNRTVNEQRLKDIQSSIRDCLRADTHEEMAKRALDIVLDTLDIPIAGVWKHQPASQQLQPLYQTTQAAELVGPQPVFSEGESVAWEAFTEGTTSIIPDVSERDNAHNPETAINGEVIVPIGDFGILTVASTHKNSFTQLDAEVLEILATNLEAIARVIDNRRDINLLDQVIARILRHNVRNKLTPALGYARKITEQAEEPLSEYAEQIVGSCEELDQTAVHAREMQEIVQNRDQTATVSLDTAVRAAAASVEQEFPGGELVSHIETTSDVTAHPQFGTAIQHLIRNGFEHNDCETPRVEVVVTQQPTGPVVKIIDNGPGIDSYELEILDEYGESELKHGSGVGLWIVDRVIKYSDAAIEFDVSDGTTATITFETDL